MLIIGLGNPGKEYEKTRHNAGFIFLNEMSNANNFSPFSFDKKFNAEISEGFLNTEKYILAKPQTFMNNSGNSVRALINFYKLEPDDIIVAADDLDIEIGNYKISRNTKAAGHNGIQSIIDNISTQNFTRIRIGIETAGGRKKRGEISGHDFVLQNFSNAEFTTLTKTINKILQDI
jgi:PTH1 family peptidyl-tRNA hydrolase